MVVSIFLNVHPYFGEMIPILTSIFFDWVESNHQLDSRTLEVEVKIYTCPCALVQWVMPCVIAHESSLLWSTAPWRMRDVFFFQKFVLNN